MKLKNIVGAVRGWFKDRKAKKTEIVVDVEAIAPSFAQALRDAEDLKRSKDS